MSSNAFYHLFSLPRELLDTLVPRNLIYDQDQQDANEVIDDRAPQAEGQRACNVCLGVSFVDVNDQRTHFRSDWHRYNVKARLSGGKAVAEADFANLLEGLEDSLSGSESSSEDGDSDSDAVRTLLSKTKLNSRSTSPEGKRAVPQTAISWFHSPPSTQLGIYRTIFTPQPTSASFLPELRSMQEPTPEGRKWTLFMVAGGHFAGVVVRVSRPNTLPDQGKGKQKKPMAEMEILHHKTFHRYTTRRKQGGSQSLNDNAKGNAKSAGALLRRYGEQALRDDIRGLIEEWSDDISASERIWLRASGANRKIFIDYDGAIIQKGDARLRTFPFPTRRPTQAELSRCLMELTKVKVTHFTEEELQAQDEAFLASLPKPKPQPRAATPQPKASEHKPEKLSKEEELLRDKWDRLIDMIKKGRMEPLKAFWERENFTFGGVDTALPEWIGEKAGTLLQIASSSGQAEVTAWLLDDLHADPTIPLPSRQNQNETDADDGATGAGTAHRSFKTAYDSAANGAVRDVFRRSAAEHPDLWDWFGAAHVPSALTKEKEEERDSKKKERRKGLKDKIKSRESRAKDPSPLRGEVVAESPPPNVSNKSGPQKLGGAPGSNEGLVGLTSEMRARIERERRRRAAEARLKGT
ncbi:hypothetical protein SCHPADRAFT_992806 [Schizopora paradoxa]|uniref:VLRF1 domain-containing protein n=1 Tax=Schizopora paradoxa TaxID=27342 RepID=A0A0H2S4T8_9AGAM|nr:hypothetical protein SCHPADRAFT_992806 [Schizopora paradoxa]